MLVILCVWRDGIFCISVDTQSRTYLISALYPFQRRLGSGCRLRQFRIGFPGRQLICFAGRLLQFTDCRWHRSHELTLVVALFPGKFRQGLLSGRTIGHLFCIVFLFRRFNHRCLGFTCLYSYFLLCQGNSLSFLLNVGNRFRFRCLG